MTTSNRLGALLLLVWSAACGGPAFGVAVLERDGGPEGGVDGEIGPDAGEDGRDGDLAGDHADSPDTMGVLDSGHDAVPGDSGAAVDASDDVPSLPDGCMTTPFGWCTGGGASIACGSGNWLCGTHSCASGTCEIGATCRWPSGMGDSTGVVTECAP
jgi:hypothetical protein